MFRITGKVTILLYCYPYYCAASVEIVVPRGKMETYILGTDLNLLAPLAHWDYCSSLCALRAKPCEKWAWDEVWSALTLNHTWNDNVSRRTTRQSKLKITFCCKAQRHKLSKSSANIHHIGKPFINLSANRPTSAWLSLPLLFDVLAVQWHQHKIHYE